MLVGCCSVLVAILAVAIASLHALFGCPRFPDPPDVSVVPGTDGWEALVRKNLLEQGYAHVKSVFNRSEAESMRRLAHDYCYGDVRKALPISWGGYSIPNFLGLPEFESVKPLLLEDDRMHQLLRAAFGDDEYRFASHNDVACDFVAVWHKDVLRGPQRKFQLHDMWKPAESGDVHEIYKILFYLQDHDFDERATKVVPRSHNSSQIALEDGYVAVHPQLGDAIIFDQRLSHSGNTYYDPLGAGRLFMQVGWGRKNVFTDEFERGTMDRQDGYQAKMLQQSQEKGWRTMLTDAKFFGLGAVMSSIPPRLLQLFADPDFAKKSPLLASIIYGSNAAKSGAK